MRKSLLSALALSAVLLTSCSNEEIVTPGNDGNVVFTVALPGEFVTRAGDPTISDGTKATKLSYAVYLQGTKNALFTSENTGDPQADPFSGLQTKLALNLAKGKTYDIVFWADKGTGSPYTFNTADQTITVDYNNVASNVEDRDAFFASKTITVTGAMEENITLKRPFAQLNFATSDLEAANKAGLDFGKTQVKVTGVHNTLNLLTGVASDSEGWDNSVTFGYAGLVDNDLHNGTADKKYNWLSMNYFLTGVEILDGDVQKADKETVDCEFKVQDKNSQEINTINIANVPVQRNYRTNIYGELLTSTVNFAIEIKPNYNEDDINLEQKEWVSNNTQVPAEIDGAITLSTPEQLAAFAESIGNGETYAGKTIKLGQDINLDGKLWKPIINLKGNQFSGTFDGDGHTISNMTVKNAEKAGFFGYMWGTLKNVTFENANVYSNHWAGVAMGYCTDHTGCNISGIKVKNSIVTCAPEWIAGESNYNNGDKAGGVVGYIDIQNGGKIDACSVENTIVQSYRDCGAIVGFSHVQITNCTAKNNTIIMDGTNHYEKTIPITINEIKGRGNGALLNNTVSGNKLVIRNFNCPEEGYASSAPANGNLAFQNMNIQSLTVRTNNAKSLSVKDCTINPAASNPGNNFRFGVYIIGDYNNNNIDFEFIGNTIKGSWGHGLFYQGSESELGSCNISGNNFADWGKKEINDKDVKTSAAIKFYRQNGITETVEQRNAFAAKVVDANNYDVTTLNTGRVKLNVTQREGSVEHTYNSKDEITE